MRGRRLTDAELLERAIEEETIAPIMWAAKIGESAFQRSIEEAAGALQYRSLHVGGSIRDDAGRPDLTLGHFARQRLIVAEIKKHGGVTSAAQRVWLDLHSYAGVETYLWFPRHWDEILYILNCDGSPDESRLSCVWPARTYAEHEADLNLMEIERLQRRAVAKRVGR